MERLAIRRGIYTVVDGIVDGFLGRLEGGEFAEADRRMLARKRFGEGQVVLGDAIAKAFPQYERLAHASVEDDALAMPAEAAGRRSEEHTVHDPYWTMHYEVPEAAFDSLEARQSVEAVVLVEALECYNEIVGMFHDGSADERHELEGVRRRFQRRYHDLVSLAELKAHNAAQSVQPPSPQPPVRAPAPAPKTPPETETGGAEWRIYGRAIVDFFKKLNSMDSDD